MSAWRNRLRTAKLNKRFNRVHGHRQKRQRLSITAEAAVRSSDDDDDDGHDGPSQNGPVTQKTTMASAMAIAASTMIHGRPLIAPSLLAAPHSPYSGDYENLYQFQAANGNGDDEEDGNNVRDPFPWELQASVARLAGQSSSLSSSVLKTTIEKVAAKPAAVPVNSADDDVLKDDPYIRQTATWLNEMMAEYSIKDIEMVTQAQFILAVRAQKTQEISDMKQAALVKSASRSPLKPEHTAAVVDPSEFMWYRRFAPRTIKQFFGHGPKKRSEGPVKTLRNWMASKNPIHRVCILSGPPGCGKSLLCTLLVEELGLGVWYANRGHTDMLQFNSQLLNHQQRPLIVIDNFDSIGVEGAAPKMKNSGKFVPLCTSLCIDSLKTFLKVKKKKKKTKKAKTTQGSTYAKTKLSERRRAESKTPKRRRRDPNTFTFNKVLIIANDVGSSKALRAFKEHTEPIAMYALGFWDLVKVAQHIRMSAGLRVNDYVLKQFVNNCFGDARALVTLMQFRYLLPDSTATENLVRKTPQSTQNLFDAAKSVLFPICTDFKERFTFDSLCALDFEFPKLGLMLHDAALEVPADMAETCNDEIAALGGEFDAVSRKWCFPPNVSDKDKKKCHTSLSKSAEHFDTMSELCDFRSDAEPFEHWNRRHPNRSELRPFPSIGRVIAPHVLARSECYEFKQQKRLMYPDTERKAFSRRRRMDSFIHSCYVASSRSPRDIVELIGTKMVIKGKYRDVNVFLCLHSKPWDKAQPVTNGKRTIHCDICHDFYVQKALADKYAKH